MTEAPWILAMPSLVALHTNEVGGVAWRLTPTGVQVGIAKPGRSPGPPATVRRVWTWFGSEIRASAIRHSVPVELIVATICAESAGGKTDFDAVRKASRREPGYVNDKDTPNRISTGVMQTLLSTARGVLRKDDLTSLELFNPAVSIEAGTMYIAEQAASTHFDPPLVAAAYNAGGLYPENNRLNRWRLRCYPLGTGRHIDTWVLWFNDALALGAGPAEDAPSFARALTI